MSIQTTRSKDFGEHSVVREIAHDETGSAYEYYKCVDCGHEHTTADSFKHVVDCEEGE